MDWIETVLNGIFLGGLYGILGLGLALVFGVMRVINVAHGDFIVLSAFIGVFTAATVPGIPPLLIILPVVAIAAVIGYAFQTALMNRVIGTNDMLVPMLLTFGVSFVMRNVMLEVLSSLSRLARSLSIALLVAAVPALALAQEDPPGRVGRLAQAEGTVWIYDADLNQASSRRLDQALGSTPAALLAGASAQARVRMIMVDSMALKPATRLPIVCSTFMMRCASVRAMATTTPLMDAHSRAT